MKSAGIYRLKDRIFIHPWQSTEAGLGMGTDPYVALPLEVDPASLGTAALKALNQSGRMVALPGDWKAQRAARLKAAGVRSETAFQTNARYVRLELSGRQLLIEPSRNGGTKGDSKGFEPLMASTLRLDVRASAPDLGKAIRQGLQISDEQSN